MNKALYKKIFWVILVLVSFFGLLSWSFTSYTVQRRRVELLTKDLDSATQLLSKTESLLANSNNQIEQLNQKSLTLGKANTTLSEELTKQKKEIAEMEWANESLERRLTALSLEREDLQGRLSKTRQRAQEQIDREEERFQEKLEAQKKDFFTQRNALSKQIAALETMLANISVRNEDLRVELNENRQMLEKLYKAKEIVDENENLLASLNRNEETLSALQIEKERVGRQLKEAKANLKEQTLRFHYNLGYFYDQSRQFKEALVEYKKALKIAPDDADLHYNLAVLYDEHIRDKEKAIYHYEIYLNLSPEAEDAPKVTYWINRAKQELASTKAGIRSTLPNSF